MIQHLASRSTAGAVLLTGLLFGPAVISAQTPTTPSSVSALEVALNPAVGTQVSGQTPSGDVTLAMDSEFKAYLAKQPPKAFLRSLILPGWGQRWGERPGRGTLYTAVDVAFLTGLVVSYQSYHSLTGEYESFAAEHAGVTGDHDHLYYVDIGNYPDMESFNTARRQMREYDTQYRGGDNYWQWDNEANRKKFKNVRINADNNKNRAYYFVGGLVLNRVISAIDAARGLQNRQNHLKQKLGIDVGVGYNPNVNGPGVTLTFGK